MQGGTSLHLVLLHCSMKSATPTIPLPHCRPAVVMPIDRSCSCNMSSFHHVHGTDRRCAGVA